MERRDIFISYTKKDTEQAVWIADVLKSHGYTVYIQQLDIKPGNNFLEKMNEFLKNSDNFLAVWSKAYSKSRFCMTEMQAAFNEWHKGRINGFLPVCIENYPMEPLYAAMVHADLFGINKASAEEVLIDAVCSLVPRIDTELNILTNSDHPKNASDNNSMRSLVKSILPVIIVALICTAALVLREPVVNWVQVLSRESSGTVLFLIGHNYGHRVSGTDMDYQKAREYYERAAEKGNSSALSDLGWFYEHGLGVEQDYTKARTYYEQAAEKGNATALNNLGRLYHTGKGVKQDYTKAREYYEQAVDKGSEAALYNLGWIYEYGQGVAVNYHKAIDYYQQAYAKGDNMAASRLFALREKLDE